ncbi:MAG: restriction endonuclease subunit S [Methylomicrobium sp.]
MFEQLAAMPKYEEYKDSGVECLGEIPEHWEIKRLKYVVHINRETLPETTPAIFEMKYVDIGSVSYEKGIEKTEDFMFKTSPSRARRLAREGDTIISTVRTYLRAIDYIDEYKNKFVYSTGFAVLSQKHINPKFLTSFVWSNAFTNQVEDESKGISYPAINSTDLSNLFFVEPPLFEQTAIAAFLDRKTAQIDQAVAIKEKQIALLKERKQILIQNAVTQGFNPDSPMRDSGAEWVGKIPKHWEMIRVKNIFRLIIESAEKNNNHELLSIYTDIGVKPRKELEEKGNKASTTDGYWLVKKGDFIINKLLAWMGAIGLSEYEGVTSPAYDILRPIKPIEGYFYHYLFRTTACSSELKKHSRGIMEMRLRLYFDKFGAVEVPYPSKEEQTAIVAHIEIESAKIDKAISLQQQQIDKLKEYKITLINSTVTGKIRVPEPVESSVPELADSLVA